MSDDRNDAADELGRLAAAAGVPAETLARELELAGEPARARARLADLPDVARRLGTLSSEERRALLILLGGSAHLSRVLRSLPDWADWLRRAVAEDLAMPVLDVPALERRAEEDPASAAAELRRWRQLAYLRIGARDLWGLAPLVETFESLTATAETAVGAATTLARAQVERDYGTLASDDGRPNRFAVLGFGKLGARELNYSSDVDLTFLHESDDGISSGGPRGALSPPLFFARVAERATKLLSEITGDGFVFRVDLRLRPDGVNGPITNSLAGTLGYYEALGQTWERAALFKARPVGGDRELAAQLLVDLDPFIFRRTLDYTMIADLERMKARVEEQERGKGRERRNVKLGAGGIREVEFFAQSFAMVHGGKDRRLRERSTLQLLRVLVDLALLSEAEGHDLSTAYAWLRRLEHALQIDEDRQLHTLPADPDGRRVLARRLGLHLEGDGPLWHRLPGADALRVFEDAHARHTKAVEQAFAALFRRRREETVASADAEAIGLVDELDLPGAAERAAELGFASPDEAIAALRLIRDGAPTARASAESRRILATLAPALLTAVRRTTAPDRALAHLADFLVKVGARRTFLALLVENRATLDLLVNLFATSDYLSRQLLGHPELLDTLVRADQAVAIKSEPDMARELDGLLADAPDLESRLDLLRRFRNDEFLRIGSHDVAGELHYLQVGAQLAALAEICLTRAYDVALAERSLRYAPPRGLSLAVVALGKLGSRELNYHSDLDLIFVYGPSSGEDLSPEDAAASETPAAQEFFARVAQLLLLVLQLATREGYVYKTDTRLRPSGRSGPLVTSLDGFAQYHAQSSAIWERQALIRARVVCGPAALARRVESIVEGFVYGRGLAKDELSEIARLRVRMEQELARESERVLNLKLGRGGLIDIEFVAQTLALTHGHQRRELRRRDTRALLEAAGEASLLSEHDHSVLADAWSFLRGLENRLRIEGEHPIERITRDAASLVSAARRMGLREEGIGAGARLLEDLDRHRAGVREVYDRLVGRFAGATGRK